MSIQYKFVEIEKVNIFYREAGNKNHPTILLLHGFPSSSHMYRNLLPELSDEYYVVAPDLPGFGNSDQPSISNFEYSFEHFAQMINQFLTQLEIDQFHLYVHDYGAPVGFILATKIPERILSIISQNGNAYEEGLLSAWDSIRAYWKHPSEENKNNLEGLLDVEFTKHQYINGTRSPESISPDSWNMDQYNLNKSGNKEIQITLFYDYRNNLKKYSLFHEYFRNFQPPVLIAWGKNDLFFGPQGAYAFENDLKNVEVHLLDTGHFPLEEDLETSSKLIKQFLSNL
ncbi:alpha/beta fold hydrolase [Bacillus solimangrovi]|uniref:Hydrolase n=1 Tax=Bacillus solimangrovi TaxID=1305675 RepID=A0A1E5LAD6_9BACI|nr:alpha/beta hydrolase [Bacillus solimangrovi]OEH91077.1 hydrolase [Bacillus solimangrovi]